MFSRYLLTFYALLLQISCGASLQAMGDTALIAPSLEDEGPVHIRSISPSWGPPAGGTSIEITGDGFDGRVRVFFGNAELSVIKTNANTVLVSAPNAGGPASVDVRLESALGEDIVINGYTFSDSAPDNSTSTAQATGLVGGALQFNRTQVACPSCLGYSAEMTVSAGLALHSPAPVSWSSWLPPMGQCAINPQNLPPVPTYLDPGEWAFLTSGSAAIALQREQGQRGPLLAADTLQSNHYISNASYDLKLEGGGVLGAFTVVNAMRAAEGFNSLSPAEMLYSDVNSAFSASFSSASTTLSWSPSGSGTDFIIDFGVYDAFSRAYIGQVICHAADTGSFTVSLGLFVDPPVLLSVAISRRVITESLLPTNGATLQAISSSTVIGTARMDY